MNAWMNSYGMVPVSEFHLSIHVHFMVKMSVLILVDFNPSKTIITAIPTIWISEDNEQRN